MTASPKKSPSKALCRARKEPASQLAKFSSKMAFAMEARGLKPASLPRLRNAAGKNTAAGAITREVIGLLRRLVAVKDHVDEAKTDGLDDVKGEVDEERMSFDAVSVDRMSGETEFFEARASLNPDYAEDGMSVDLDSVRDSMTDSIDEKRMPILSPVMFRQRVDGPDRFANLYRQAVAKPWCIYCLRYAVRSYAEAKTEVLRVKCTPPSDNKIRCPTCCDRNLICNPIPAMMMGDRDDLVRILELVNFICSFSVTRARRQTLAVPLKARKRLVAIVWDLASAFTVAITGHVKEHDIGGPKKSSLAESKRRRYRINVEERKRLLLSTFPVPKTRRDMEEETIWTWQARTSPRITADEKAYLGWHHALDDCKDELGSVLVDLHESHSTSDEVRRELRGWAREIRLCFSLQEESV
ncbi:hypothetical protein GQ602_006806 [Ophiocordyceps camponoti-floridani]|uniref:Uncharacterized protein n=1 Tax=Ophiocordyceps camponoti-floridani TaxID=2030778 RepID=A0A8H4VBD0_9HYPO|nr:hypothetical protein GQ602_006806 [Ophiocordyceps camponoti-floridani]